MNRVLLCCFLLFAFSLARNPRDRYGILYVNEIVANSDTFTVQIEDSFVEDNILRLDIINEWTGQGVTSEGIFFDDGSVILADDFVVNPPTTFPNRVNANGGIYADAGLEDFSSFVVEDDTGRTSIRGVVSVQGGIFTPNDAFTVAGGNGETTVRQAGLNADGGVDVNGGSFTVSPVGDVFVASTLAVRETIFLGSNRTEDRSITRVYSAGQLGGDTIVSAQDGVATGGDLFIVPGSATSCSGADAQSGCDDGSVFIGRQTNDNIVISRPDVNGPGARTVYNGQDSINGDGGDINIAAGDSLADGDGGDLIIVPGLSASGNHGSILFGSAEPGESDFDIIVGRPRLNRGNGGDTFFVGQNTVNGPAGDLYIQGGQGSNGGSLFIVPGDADQDFGNIEEQGDIIFGDDKAANLDITRSPSSGTGGETLFEGQSSDENRGGDMYIRAGNSEGTGNGGNVILRPGSNPATPGQAGVPSGDIIWGDQVEDLTVTRVARDGGGLDTCINGQPGDASQGGDLFFIAGQGNTLGGDLLVQGGQQVVDSDISFAVGGSVEIHAGDGQIDGGAITISAGVNDIGQNSGDIVIGNAPNVDFAGDVRFNCGSGDVLGDVVVGDFSDEFILQDTPLVIQDSFLLITDGDDEVIFRADPTNIVQYNGKTLLRSVSDYLVPAVPTFNIAPINDPLLTQTAYRVNQLQNSVEILVNALSQCQHGLFETVDSQGIVDSCDFDLIRETAFSA